MAADAVAPFASRDDACCFCASYSWWRHQIETFSMLLAICAGNSPVPGEFPAQRPVTRSFDVFFDLRPNKRLSKHPWGWWFETLSRPLWRHRNLMMVPDNYLSMQDISQSVGIVLIRLKHSGIRTTHIKWRVKMVKINWFQLCWPPDTDVHRKLLTIQL